ncbi:MAG: hypothetical protein HGB19_04575 [Chlorobiales bacterium]|nr:hypothetical protein [Chlorobiales bacterium]
MSRIRHFIDEALHLIYPNVCICCEALLEEGDRYICQTCKDGFDRFSLPNESTDEILIRLQRNFPGQKVILDAISCYRFHKDGLLQEAIHAMKYGGLRSLAIQLGGELGEKIRKDRPDMRYGAIVPVPLHQIKRIERSYNQSELLATGIASVLQVQVLAGARPHKQGSTFQNGRRICRRLFAARRRWVWKASCW